MGEVLPAVAVIPPKLEVGYNYPWAFNAYGTHIGPRDLENDPPLGNHSDVALFRDVKAHPPEGSLARNLVFLRDELNIRKVRVFILGNLWNYGKIPPIPKAVFFPPDPHPLFAKHFRDMLEVFASKEMQIIPSLVDFGALYELDPFDLSKKRFLGAGSGRTSIALGGRKRFFDTMLKNFLDISSEPALKKTIFAWEVINEPRWNLVNTSLPFSGHRPHTTTDGQDMDESEMKTFIREALDLIEARGFESTVGHRFFGDLQSTMSGGTKPQFHYYALFVPAIAKLMIAGDPQPIPTAADLAADLRTKGAFMGEFHSDPDRLWPECNGADNTLRTASFERLKVLARKGYSLALIWPDGGNKDDVNNNDALKLSPDSIASIKQFTRGLFPNGVP